MGGYTKEDWDELAKQYHEYKNKFRDTIRELDNYYNRILQLKNEVTELNKRLADIDNNIVVLTVKNKNAGDKIIINGQELISDSISLLKGSPVEISIYDKDGKLYPNLVMENNDDNEDKNNSKDK